MSNEKDLSTVILGGVSAFLLAILLYQNFIPGAFSFNKNAGLSGVMRKDDVANKAIAYIKNNLATSPDIEFTLVGSEEKSGVYEVSVDVLGQKDKVYASKDGKLLFLNSFDMNPPEEKTLTKTDKPKVELFVMAFRPFGNQAESLMKAVVDLLGNKADIQLQYVFYNKDQGYTYPDYCYDEAGQYCSMHGIQELNQGVRELCVQKYQPDKLWSFVSSINAQATAQNVDSKWEAIASSNGINVDKIKQCQSEEATTLMAQEVSLTNQEYPVQNPASHKNAETAKIAGSPTILINGIIYDGKRGSEAYKEAICSTFNNAPSECQQTITESAGSTTTDPQSCQ
jgi:hypothetical protein